MLLMFSFSFRRMFYGFKSRWQMFFSCRYAIAENICLIIIAVCASVKNFFSTIR